MTSIGVKSGVNVPKVTSLDSPLEASFVAKYPHYASGNRSGGYLQGEQILVIDDVCTTGSTLGACAEALKERGTEKVWGLTVAREA
jgi:orotate phosphoribosyltransferase